jgi:hypothetical protein
MKRQMIRTIKTRSFALVVLLNAAWYAQAQQAETTYPKMAPLDQYLMAGEVEVALARTAAPESISRDAEVLVLGRHGYETAEKARMVSCARLNAHGPPPSRS